MATATPTKVLVVVDGLRRSMSPSGEGDAVSSVASSGHSRTSSGSGLGTTSAPVTAQPQGGSRTTGGIHIPLPVVGSSPMVRVGGVVVGVVAPSPHSRAQHPTSPNGTITPDRVTTPVSAARAFGPAPCFSPPSPTGKPKLSPTAGNPTGPFPTNGNGSYVGSTQAVANGVPGFLSRGQPQVTVADKEDDGDSVYSGHSSNASSVRDDLPLCPDDEVCIRLNERAHQRSFAHTCRLHPCYHGNVRYHSRLFRHAPGQVVSLGDDSTSGRSTPDPHRGGTRHRRRTKKALASVSYSSISPDAPNASKITVAFNDSAYEIWGDWANVKVHTLKRYLHQVLGVPPAAQKLLVNFREYADDDLASASELGITCGAVVAVQIIESKLDPSALTDRLCQALDSQSAAPRAPPQDTTSLAPPTEAKLGCSPPPVLSQSTSGSFDIRDPITGTPGLSGASGPTSGATTGSGTPQVKRPAIDDL